MGGMKSGTGDDLWDEDDETEDQETSTTPEHNVASDTADTSTVGESESDSTADSKTSTQQLPYVAERAVKGKSTQWRREERLTFFVRDRVADGERELVTAVNSALERDVPKFDVREAAYLVAQNHPEEVIEQLREMGYEAVEK